MVQLEMVTVDTDKISFKTRGPKSNKWAGLLENIAELEVDGSALSIRIPTDANGKRIDPTKFRNTIGQVVSSQGYNAHELSSEDIKFRTRLTTDESSVVITCHARVSDGVDDGDESDNDELDDLD